MREYKDKFTYDGRVQVVPGVTKRKVAAVQALTEKHLAGDGIASATLKEALTSSDAIFSAAHLATLNFLPNFDEAPRTWRSIAGIRTVSDFRPATLYSLNRSWTDGDGGSNVLDSYGGAPTIPEGTAYPYAYISGQNAQGGSVTKKGLKTDWTLESRINDGLGVIDELPSELTSVSLDTEEADVYSALLPFVRTTAATELDGGLVPTGNTVLPNATLNQDSLIRALIELSEREINGRKIRVTGGYNLLVATGQGIFAQFILNQTFSQVVDGSFVLNIDGYNPLAGVSVVEVDYLVAPEWIVLPKPGATRRPVLDRLELRGYQTPQLFVDNHVGIPIGAASVAPFEGSYAADVITLKLRQFGGAAVWDSGAAIVYSTGLGVV
ncbi:MAG: hypothetical protein WAZ75_05050 [Candidatus Absconditicoccaceae bacterium]